MNFIWWAANRPLSSLESVVAPSSSTLNVGEVSSVSLSPVWVIVARSNS